MDDELKSFEVVSLELFEKGLKNSNATENFVPLISKKQMDAQATDFLRKYYPQALLEPIAVPIRNIASKIGLSLQFGFMLSEDFSHFGQISFSNMKTTVYDIYRENPKNLWDSDDKWNDQDWIEWHANSIGTRILMPTETLPKKSKR